MNKNFVTHYRNPAEFRRDHYRRREQFQRDTALPLAASWIIIVLSSLGLWWWLCWRARDWFRPCGGRQPPADNGMLHVDVVHEVPEAAKPRTIKIGTSVEPRPQVTEQKAA